MTLPEGGNSLVDGYFRRDVHGWTALANGPFCHRPPLLRQLPRFRDWGKRLIFLGQVGVENRRDDA